MRSEQSGARVDLAQFEVSRLNVLADKKAGVIVTAWGGVSPQRRNLPCRLVETVVCCASPPWEAYISSKEIRLQPLPVYAGPMDP